MNNAIAERIKASLDKEGKLPCAVAFTIVDELGVTPAQVGEAANELDVRINKCQLGLFGYGPKSSGNYKIVKAAETVDDGLAARLRDGLVEGKLPCAVAWVIADEMGLKKLEVSNAAERLGISISPCQLGCF